MGENRKVVERVWEIMMSRSFDRIGEVLSPDIEFAMPGGIKLRGIDAFRGMLAGWLEAFPDMRMEIRETVEQADTIAVRLFVRGTHTGPLRSPEGTIPATGREVVWDSVDWVKVSGGKVTAWNVYEDSMAMMKQLGLVK